MPAGKQTFDQVQLETPQILGRSQIGRAAKEKGKLCHRPQVAGLCSYRSAEYNNQAHVFMRFFVFIVSVTINFRSD